MVKINKILYVIILMSIFGAVTIGVHFLATDHHHEPGCPFMPFEQAICPMGLMEHISKWKESFLLILPSLILVLVVIISFIRKILSPPISSLIHKLRSDHNINQKYSIWAELYSNGILNPKAP